MTHPATFLSDSASSALLSLATTADAGLWQRFNNVVANNQQLSLYAAIVLLAVLLLLIWKSNRARRDFRVYNDESGTATVSARALRHLIQMSCEEVGTASSPRIRFSQSRGRVNVQIAIKLYHNQRLNQIHEQLRQRIRKSFEETHGIQVGNVSLKVIGFKKNRDQSSEEADVAPTVIGYGNAEASAASLYEEPVTSDLLEDEPDTNDSKGSDSDKTSKRRGWSLFGRREKEPEAELFIDAGEAADQTDTTSTAGSESIAQDAKTSDSTKASDSDTNDKHTGGKSSW